MHTTRILCCLTMIAGVCATDVVRGADEVIDLAGTWSVALDREDRGLDEKWYEKTFDSSLKLPGSLQAQGFGDEVDLETPWVGAVVDRSYFEDERYAPYRKAGNMKVPFWLQPEKYYKGAAWYGREFSVPASWGQQRVTLSLERAHWETTVWIDGKQLGSADSLSTPHQYVIGRLAPGTHRIAVRVDNRLKYQVGVNSHSVSDHTQSNWNGLVGKIALRATPDVWVEDVQVYPHASRKSATVKLRVGNATGKAAHANIVLKARCKEQVVAPQTVSVAVPTDGSTQECELKLGADARLWDEFSPNLYELDVVLTTDDGQTDQCNTTFGLRDLAVKGTQFTINGRPMFLRGTLECAIFPLTGYPPTDVEHWRRIIGTCKAYGLNHMRFHSWCPPEAAFVAADELGFYLQVECASWANSGAKLGDGNPLDEWLYEEAGRITRSYGNHPSFALMAYGNEPGGNHKPYLQKWCSYWRENEPRMLHTSGAGWPLIPESDYHISPKPRIQAWGGGLSSIINAQPPQTLFDFSNFLAEHADKPTVSHEIGQWCAFPNFEEIRKYTGVLKPKNFEVFRDFLNQAKMGDQAHDFLMASGKLQALCYKADIEAALRTRGFGGFQLLDLHDFPGQGTALVGILDPFWESKGYVTPEEHRRYCGPCVPLARMEKMVWGAEEFLTAQVEVANFGPADLTDAEVRWKLVATDGTTLNAGSFQGKAIPTGRNSEVGWIDAPLSKVTRAQKLVLHIAVPAAQAENTWDLWVYPTNVPHDIPADVHWTYSLDDDAKAVLQRGGDVFLMLPPDRVKTDVALGFSSIFWNTAWTRGQAPHTLGILCDPSHPALRDLPTDSHSNWQWWEVVHRGAVMELDAFPGELRPIVQVVPDWFRPKRLALVFEARVLNGRMLVCSIDLLTRLQERLVARQLRASLLRYMQSDSFNPQVKLTAEQISSLIKPPTAMQRFGATIIADSQQAGYEAVRAIDDDPTTCWHTAWQPQSVGQPHRVVIDLQDYRTIRGIRYLPRQDASNGRIAEYRIYAGGCCTDWKEPLVTGKWPNNAQMQEVRFAEPIKTRFVRIESKSEVSGKPWTSIAEIDLIE